ncbi:hypothetical protein M0R45_025922 [Rubus argutus]|uniref:Uncharacterized protein n=1 Tax=Rubus argutus TaxID=59490 RepID=A0AAW1WZD7_RUBAR
MVMPAMMAGQVQANTGCLASASTRAAGDGALHGGEAVQQLGSAAELAGLDGIERWRQRSSRDGGGLVVWLSVVLVQRRIEGLGIGDEVRPWACGDLWQRAAMV